MCVINLTFSLMDHSNLNFFWFIPLQSTRLKLLITLLNKKNLPNDLISIRKQKL